MSSLDALLKIKDHWLQLAVSKGLVTEAELIAAVANAESQRVEASMLLMAAGKLTEQQVAELKAEAAGVVFVDVSDYQLDAEALKLVPESVARKHHVLPLYRIQQALTVAMADPWDAVAIDALRACTKLPIIHPVVGTAEAIRRGIEHYYGLQVVEQASKSSTAARAPQTGGGPAADRSPSALVAGPVPTATDDVSIIKLVDALIREALDLQASDVHLEPEGGQTRVRVRIDGVLHELKQFPIGLHEPLCSRLKILAKLDIAEHRLPQDGHIGFPVGSRVVDLRLSTYPTVAGENIVIRLLDSAALALQLPQLGFLPDVLGQFQQVIQRPHGMILVTGPTGSGKTTSLYAALTHINTMTKNIMTIEDPVEYHLPLIRQTQINLKAGVTFATGLRSILRQDPDVIMVGEIRDQDTAEIAIHAALTGHLVLSTLHTNDSAGAVARLLDMGAEPYLLASTLLAVIGQRLVRRICAQCQEGSRPSLKLRQRFPDLTVLYRGRGCAACRQTGFQGRLGIFELLLATESFREPITSRASSDVLKRLAIQHGMRTMRADGLLKAQQGLTALDELDRVVPAELATER